MRSPALSRIARGLSSRTSTAAIIAGFVLVAPISHAISAGFAGTGVASSGSFDQVGPSSIVLNTTISNQGVINWTPTDNANTTASHGTPIDFLPAMNGQSVNTVSFSGNGPYTILNRIAPADVTRPIALNGTVNSFISSSPGGSIWFYSPAGILVGGSAVFNVGSLLLTTADPDITSGSFIDGNGHFTVGQATPALPGSYVSMASGATVNANIGGSALNSYVAMIAPSITQGGTVNVNGSAAYVAGQAVSMTINQGLFDISVTTGTDASPTPLTHSGTTTGPAATQGQTHRVYLVAVPKNDAITLLVGGSGSLGFDIAGAADVVGNAIVLSAGRNVANGVAVPDSGPATAADVTINRGSLTSAVFGTASNNAGVTGAGGPTRFYSDLSLTAPVSAAVYATSANNPVQIDGSLTLDASRAHTVTGGSVIGGSATAMATNGGTLTINGNASLIANGTGNGSSANGGLAVNATGGSVNLQATGATITVLGDTTLSANGMAGTSSASPTTPLQINGGLANVQVGGAASSIHLHGGLTATSTAMGGFDTTGNTNAGTAAQGGIVSLSSNAGGTLAVDGPATFSADAMGGGVAYGPTGGAGTGGQVSLAASGAPLTFGSFVIATANGQGGDGYSASGTGGAGTGGSVTAASYSGTLTVSGEMTQHADGSGGFGYAAGGAGTGGAALVQTGQTGVVHLDGGVDLTANGVGGDTPTYMTSTITAGGNGLGGDASLFVPNGGAMTVADHIALSATGAGGDGINGGNGSGGGKVTGIGASIRTQGGNLTFTPPSTNNPNRSAPVQLSADGFGGFGNTLLDGTAGRGGSGTGGMATVLASSGSASGTLTLSTALITANGLGGIGGDGNNAHDGGAGGDGVGGVIGASAQAGNGHLVIGTVQLSATGAGGEGGYGTNGGTGGKGTGGNNQSGLFSGDETILPTSGTTDFGAYVSNTSGIGGDGGGGDNLGGNGGAGIGGLGNIVSRGGIVHVASVALAADGRGGNGGSSASESLSKSGIGGDGAGGNFAILSTPRFMVGTASALAIAGAATGSASGVGGSGRQTGTTTAGNFVLQATGGSLSANSIALSALGTLVPTTGPASEISSVGTGTIAVSGSLTAVANGDLGLYFDAGGTLNAASASLSARSVTPFGGQDTAAPAGTGTFRANTLAFNVLQDFRTTTSFDTAGAFQLFVPGVTQVGAINAGLGITINFNNAAGAVHGTGLTTGNLTTGRIALLQTDGNASIGSVTAGDGIFVISGGTTAIGNLSAGRVNPVQGPFNAFAVNVFANGGSTIGSVTAKGEVRFGSLNGSVSAGDIVTGRDLIVLAKQDVTLGAVTTSLVPTVQPQPNNAPPIINPGGVYIGRSNGTIVPAAQTFPVDPNRIDGSITINGAVTTGQFRAAASGTIKAPSINADDIVSLDAGVAITINALRSRYDTDITGDGAVTLGSFDTGGDGNIKVAGKVIVTSATAGRVAFTGTTQAGPGSQDEDSSIVLVGGKGVSLGSGSAKGAIGLVSDADIVSGTLVSDGSAIALAGGSVTLGAVTTGGGTDGVYIGNSSLYPQVANSDDKAVATLFAMTPPPAIGGSILISGPVSAGRFEAAASGAITTGALTVANGIQAMAGGSFAGGAMAAGQRIALTSGGLATFNGAVTAPTIAVSSLDIAIGSAASLGNGSTSSLKLTSSATDTTIGTAAATSGQSGAATAYLLDNAEFARLRGAQIDVAAAGNVTLATLNINGSASNSGNLVGSNARFQVQTPGSIRIGGSVNLANAAATDTLGFIAGNRFEIATDTGQLQLQGTNGKVGGIAAITAANIAVGTSDILTRLAADPKFTGRDALLAAAPLSGSKLDGYLQAGQMKFTVGNTLLIQNSGSGSTLAGFTVGSGGIQIANGGASPIDVVIYGRAFDSSGVEIATASIGSAVTASQTSTGSNVDGCVFATGVCSPVNTGASAQTVAQTQLASISSSVKSAIVGNVGAGVRPRIENGTSNVGAPVEDIGGGRGGDGGPRGDAKGGDGEDEPAAKGNGGAAAAARPNVLIDTNAIAASVAPQVDTPVTSSGNTSLWIGEDGLTGDIGTGNSQ